MKALKGIATTPRSARALRVDRQTLITYIIVLLLVLAGNPVLAECHTVAWGSSPQMLSSAAWTAEKELTIVDAGIGELQRFRLGPALQSKQGAFPAEAPADLMLTLTQRLFADDAFPVQRFMKNAAGYLLQGPSGLFLQLGHQFDELMRFSLIGTPSRESDDQLASIFQWISTSATSLAVFGDVGTPDLGYEVSFSTVETPPVPQRQAGEATPVARTVEFAPHLSRGFRDNSKLYYSLAYPYLTQSDAGDVYALVMDNTPAVVRLVNGPEKYTYEVHEHGRIPQAGGFTRAISPHDTKAFFAAIREASLPVGLFAQGQYLFVLQKDSIYIDARRRWSLSRFNVMPDGSVGYGDPEQVYLPISEDTEHVTLVPGGDYWLVAEKGEVSKAMKMPIRTSWLFSSSELAAADWDPTVGHTLCSSSR